MDPIENNDILDKNISTDDIKGREFYYCKFINCQFNDLPEVKFYNCTFINCNLSNSNLQDTHIRDCIFTDSKLIGIGVSKNNFAFSANFFSCDLRYVEFLDVHLQGIEINHCNCEYTRFSNCKIKNSTLVKSNFKEAIFNRCDIQDTKFMENQFLIINPNANKIKRTKIDIETAINIATFFGFKVI
jgi:uncharacterized protein YjbI with pentapeptide repeats